MASEKITVAPGVQKDAELVDIVKSNEPWTTYELADGSVLSAKVVVSEVWRIKDEYDDAGNPAYFIKASPLLNTRAPEALRRKNH